MTPSAWAMERAAPHIRHTQRCWVRMFYGDECECEYDERRDRLALALDAAYAQGRRDERADVVAWLRLPRSMPCRACNDDSAYDAAQTIKEGAHVPAAADAGRADRGEG